MFAAQAKYPSLKIVHQKKLAKMYIFYALHVIAKFIASLISSLYPSSKMSLARKVFSGGYNEHFVAAINFILGKCRFYAAPHSIVTLVVFNQQAETAVMEGEEYWPKLLARPVRAWKNRCWSQPT